MVGLCQCSLLLHGLLSCPVFRNLNCSWLICLPVLSDIVRKRIIRVRRAEECLNGQEDGSNL